MPKCKLCNKELSKFTILATRENIRFNCYGKNKAVIKCDNCGLTQLLPQWAEKELNKIYRDYNKQKDFPNQKNISRRVSKYLLKYIKKYDYVLEIGCGRGDNIDMLRKNGCTGVFGIDRDKSVGNNNSIYTFDYRKFLPLKNEFDCIYSIHLFEHIADPLDFLDRTVKSLKSNGRIILEFPNVEEPLLTLYKSKAFNKFYWRPDHLFFYSPITVIEMLCKIKEIKYKVRRIQNYGIVNHLNWLIRKKPTNLKINIPIVDSIYKFILTKLFKVSDTILVIITKE
jgi:SAM-dependent methyltransferase